MALDPRTRTPHTDEFSLAFDRAIRTGVRASAAYIRKRGSDYLGWVDTRGQYEEQTRTLADGTTLPVFALTNATSDRRFLLTNRDSMFVAYDGLVLALEKRLSKGWQASGSYTFSRAHGLQVTSNGHAEEPQFSTIARAGYLTFGQDPNDLTNAAGRLPNDRPHVFRATSVVRLWRNLRFAANLQHFSGKPWAATTQERLPQGSRRILLEPRGTRRLSSQSLLDLRVSKTLPVFGAGTADLILDVLNVLNDTAEEALVSDNRFAATFGTPRLFIDPRRAMVAIKVLPTAFSHDPDRQRRFEREARAAASLNHPNIVAVHDAGVHEGVAFIVTELLEGETLRQRMNGPPLSARRAIEYAIQIASGLAAGHQRGIVHRDIKPDNLFVTKDGRVKIAEPRQEGGRGCRSRPQMPPSLPLTAALTATRAAQSAAHHFAQNPHTA